MSNFIFNLELSLNNYELLKNNIQIVELKIPEPKIVVKVNSELENFDANTNDTENIFKDNDIFTAILEITKNFGIDILEQSSAEIFPEIGRPFELFTNEENKKFLPTAQDLIIAQWAINLNLIHLKNTEFINFVEVKTELEKLLRDLGEKQFIDNIWQGINYALIMNNVKLSRTSNFNYINNFSTNIKKCLIERKLKFDDDDSQPKEFIINNIYFMLKELVKLRNSRKISFEHYNNLIDNISNKLAEKTNNKLNITLVLNTSILAEASQHLGEISLHENTDRIMSDCYDNCIKLKEILRGLNDVEDIIGYSVLSEKICIIKVILI